MLNCSETIFLKVLSSVLLSCGIVFNFMYHMEEANFCNVFALEFRIKITIFLVIAPQTTIILAWTPQSLQAYLPVPQKKTRMIHVMQSLKEKGKSVQLVSLLDKD